MTAGLLSLEGKKVGFFLFFVFLKGGGGHAKKERKKEKKNNSMIHLGSSCTEKNQIETGCLLQASPADLGDAQNSRN